jgi:HKD family nuclease
MDLEIINSLFEDIKNKKFKKGNKRYTDVLLKDDRVKELRNFLDEEYVKKGIGIKCLIKDYKLNITYSILRKILIFLNYELHSNTIANEALKKRRSDIFFRC